MEIIPDGVIDESLSYLGFTTGLVLKHHIIIPPKPTKCMQNQIRLDHENKPKRLTIKTAILVSQGVR